MLHFLKKLSLISGVVGVLLVYTFFQTKDQIVSKIDSNPSQTVAETKQNAPDAGQVLGASTEASGCGYKAFTDSKPRGEDQASDLVCEQVK